MKLFQRYAHCKHQRCTITGGWHDYADQFVYTPRYRTSWENFGNFKNFRWCSRANHTEEVGSVIICRNKFTYLCLFSWIYRSNSQPFAIIAPEDSGIATTLSSTKNNKSQRRRTIVDQKTKLDSEGMKRSIENCSSTQRCKVSVGLEKLVYL